MRLPRGEISERKKKRKEKKKKPERSWKTPPIFATENPLLDPVKKSVSFFGIKSSSPGKEGEERLGDYEIEIGDY